MSLFIQGGRTIQTPGNSLCGNNQTRLSIGFWFMCDPSASSTSLNGTTLFDRNFGASWFISGQPGTNSGNIGLRISFVGIGGGYVYVPIGVPAYVLFTHDGVGNQQWSHVNGESTLLGTGTGATQSVSGRAMGAPNYAPGANAKYHVADLAIWHGVALSSADGVALRDGANPTTIGGGATLRHLWTFAVPGGKVVGDTVASGDSGCNDYHGNASCNFTVFGGTGTATYSGPMAWAPPAQVSEVKVGPSGKTVFVFTTLVSTGASTAPNSFGSPTPTIKVNGGSPQTLTPLIASGVHPYAVYGSPVAITANDSVTLDAAVGSIGTVAGPIAAATNLAATNRVGRSMVRADDFTPTLRPGYNLAWYMCGQNAIIPMMRDRHLAASAGLNVATRNANGKPTQLNSSPHVCSLIEPLAADNGIDNTGYPGPVGLFAIGWDCPDGSTSFAFNPDPATTVVTPRTEYDNPGTNGVGIVKVFEVTRAGASTQAGIKLDLQLVCPSLTPNFDNLVIHGPGDFTPGTPTVLDKSDRYAFSKLFLDRAKGAGSIRSWDGLMATTSPHEVEPEHLIDETRFRWGFGNGTIYRTIYFNQALPYSPATYPYLYWHSDGEKYDCALASGIDSTQTTLTITDAATAPVFTGLRLFAGSEEMRVVSVSGTTVTVKRGANGTTPASHSAGTIQCGYRSPMPAIGATIFNNGAVVVLRSSDAAGATIPHEMVTGQAVTPSGNGWSDLPSTDANRTINPRNWSCPAWVVGPDKLVIKVGHSAYNGSNFQSPCVTLAGTTSLTAANCNTLSSVAGPVIPCAVLAKAANALDVPACFFAVAHAASNDLVRHVAAKIRDNIDPHRDVYIEVSNEVWNFAIPRGHFQMLSTTLHPGGTLLDYYAKRTAEVGDIFRAVFDEGGRNRSGQIKCFLNDICVNPTASLLNFAAAQSPKLRIDAVAVAPYIETGWTDSLTNAAYAVATTEQLPDIYGANLWYYAQSNSLVAYAASWRTIINNYKTATGYDCKLVAYEGGLEHPVPGWVTGPGTVSVTSGSPTVTGSGTKFTLHYRVGASIQVKRPTDSDSAAWPSYTVASIASDTSMTLTTNYADDTLSGRTYRVVIPQSRERGRDLLYDPNFYIAEQDFYATMQREEFTLYNVFALSHNWFNGTYLWGHYHGQQQQPGRGDGSDGKFNNRLTLAQTKASNVNQELNTVSVRGQAWLDWNANFEEEPPPAITGPRPRPWLATSFVSINPFGATSKIKGA